MRELNSILNAWRVDREAKGVLATVVHVEGSAYRRPGARMLIGNNGSRIGTISGGCLEGDVARKAAWWTAGGKPVLRVYDTSSDEDAVWEFGLGCNGVIYVLLEAVESAAAQSLLDFLDQGQKERRDQVVATVVRTLPGSTYQVGDHFFGSRLFNGAFCDAAQKALAEHNSYLLHAQDADVFIEFIAPPQQLVIFGAGHDVVPVVAAASVLGWEITVADVRSGYAKPDRFPGAASVVLLPPSGNLGEVQVRPETAVVFMTHNYNLDKALLPQVLPHNPGYLGLLGPKRRTAKLFGEIGLDSALYDLHAPAGLDVGGDSPEIIALAIVAEIQSYLGGRAGGSLRWRSGPIHAQVKEVGQAAEMTRLESELVLCETTHG